MLAVLSQTPRNDGGVAPTAVEIAIVDRLLRLAVDVVYDETLAHELEELCTSTRLVFGRRETERDAARLVSSGTCDDAG